jgi:hypothetical protein
MKNTITKEIVGEETDMSTKVKVPCVVCGKKFDPQGLAGHMRFVHGLEPSDQKKNPAANASLDVKSLMDELKVLKERKAELKKTVDEDTDWKGSPKPSPEKSLLEVVELQIVKLVERIAELKDLISKN